jgi:hypothetical protein
VFDLLKTNAWEEVVNTRLGAAKLRQGAAHADPSRPLAAGIAGVSARELNGGERPPMSRERFARWPLGFAGLERAFNECLPNKKIDGAGYLEMVQKPSVAVAAGGFSL